MKIMLLEIAAKQRKNLPKK